MTFWVDIVRAMKKKPLFKKNTIRRVPTKSRADVLLIYPPWVVSGFRSQLQRMLPPLGILSIASYLEAHGYEVHIVDLHAETIGPEEFRTILRSLKPRYVGITVLSAHYVPAHHIATICKEEIADAQVIVGGVHAEAEPEHMLQNPHIDAVVRGDGEEAMLELVQGKAYKAIAGLSFREGERVVHNLGRPVVMELDKYPLPAYHLIDFDNYFPPVGAYKDLPATNLLMTRGCPGKCTFCNSANTVLRSRNVENMIRLIKMLRYEYGIRQVYFYDDTFTANKKITTRFCEAMIREKIDVKWICYVRGDMFNDEAAEMMSKAGCHQVLVGVESGSSTLMAKIGKPIQKEKYINIVKIAHRHKIEVRGSFIIGHIDETQETMQETLDFAKKMDLDMFHLSVLTPYPGTQLFKQAKEDGLLLHENYSLYGQNETVLRLKNLGTEEVRRFERYALYKFYFRPKAIYRHLKRLTKLHQIADLFKAVYIIFLDKILEISPTVWSGRIRGWMRWLDFNLESVVNPSIKIPNTTRLSFEVRQNPEIFVETIEQLA